jgi:crotonobetainyl-CoA:carnitine CoA-transferase CaiB-like acyl-CoA transferase
MVPPIKEAIGKLPQDEVAKRCERANVSWSPVGQPADLFADAHLMASGGLLDVFVSRAGGAQGPKVGLPAVPVEFGQPRERPGLRRQPPRMGEHNDEILGEAGFSQAEIAALREVGAITGAT